MSSEIFSLNERIKVVYSHSRSEVAHIGLMVGIGSRNDTMGMSGMAHFIEHMWFKGTTNRTSREIIDDIELLGGDFNAFTSKEETCIHVSVLKDSVKVALEVLNDIFTNSIFSADEINKEREVILDEIDSYDDSPAELIFDEFEGLLFEKSTLSSPILGTKKALQNIDASTMKSFYVENYLSAKVVLSFVGDIPFSDFTALVRSSFSDTTNGNSIRLNTVTDLLHLPTFTVSKKRKTSQAHCMIGCTAYSWDDERRLSLSMLNNIVGGPFFSSILNYSLREISGLTYNIESTYTPYSDTGSFLIYFGTDKKKVSLCYDIIKDELKMITDSDLLDRNIAVYKKQLLGQLALSYESNVNIMISQAKNVLVYDRVDDFAAIAQKIQAIDSFSLKEVAKQILDFDKMSFLTYC